MSNHMQKRARWGDPRPTFLRPQAPSRLSAPSEAICTQARGPTRHLNLPALCYSSDTEKWLQFFFPAERSDVTWQHIRQGPDPQNPRVLKWLRGLCTWAEAGGWASPSGGHAASSRCILINLPFLPITLHIRPFICINSFFF